MLKLWTGPTERREDHAVTPAPTLHRRHRGPRARPLLGGDEVAPRVGVGRDEEAARVVADAEAAVGDLERMGWNSVGGCWVVIGGRLFDGSWLLSVGSCFARAPCSN
jgi:hypothetical protein